MDHKLRKASTVLMAATETGCTLTAVGEAIGTHDELSPENRCDAVILSGMARSVAQLAWTFIDAVPPSAPTQASSADAQELLARLCAAHDRLVDQTHGLSSANWLEFVAAVGVVVQEMRRYVERY